MPFGGLLLRLSPCSNSSEWGQQMEDFDLAAAELLSVVPSIEGMRVLGSAVTIVFLVRGLLGFVIPLSATPRDKRVGKDACSRSKLQNRSHRRAYFL